MTAQEQSERMRSQLAFLLVGTFVACVPLFIFKDIPETNKDIITYMVGQLSGMALMALGFYFANKVGQDALDSKRAETTGKMADAIVAAASSTPAVPDVAAAGQAADAVADAATDKAEQINRGES